MRTYVRGYAQRAAEDQADGPIRFVAVNEGRMADGLDLRMDGLDLTRFESNPIVLYGHNPFGRDSLPIGRADASVDGDRLMADITFDMGDEFATEVDRKIRGGFLNAVSVGFDAHDIGQDGVPARWELFEISVVPLPMDPGATAEGRELALARALTDVRAGKVLSKANKTLVQNALDALSALLEAAGTEDEEPRAASGLDARRRRLRLTGQ